MSIRSIEKKIAWGFMAKLILFGGMALLLSQNAFGQQSEPEEGGSGVEDTVSEKPRTMVRKASEEEADDNAQGDLLVVGTRVDAAFYAGTQVQQGFSIPSLRLWATGEVNPSIGYRVSVGQTREYSTVMLPQLIPVEAYLDLLNSQAKIDSRHDCPWRFRAGMFNPSLNPWWTPDLGYLDIPDYYGVHKDVLLSNDIGAELSYYPLGNSIQLSAGAFNGSGIFGLNTNSSKAFTGFAKGDIPLGDATLSVGASYYLMNQSSVGSVNYKANWVADVFMSLTLQPVVLTAEGFTGNFTDATRMVSPSGGAGSVTVTVLDWAKVFARFEGLSASPTTGRNYTHYQLGPLLNVNPKLKVFGFFDSTDESGGTENSIQVRLRLVI